MKFSDMMGKGDKGATVEADAVETVIPPLQRSAPPAPDAPIRFGTPRTDPATSAPSDTAALPVQEPPAGAASSQQLDASAWLDGIPSVVDDLLPS